MYSKTITAKTPASRKLSDCSDPFTIVSQFTYSIRKKKLKIKKTKKEKSSQLVANTNKSKAKRIETLKKRNRVQKFVG